MLAGVSFWAAFNGPDGFSIRKMAWPFPSLMLAYSSSVLSASPGLACMIWFDEVRSPSSHQDCWFCSASDYHSSRVIFICHVVQAVISPCSQNSSDTSPRLEVLALRTQLDCLIPSVSMTEEMPLVCGFWGEGWQRGRRPVLLFLSGLRFLSFTLPQMSFSPFPVFSQILHPWVFSMHSRAVHNLVSPAYPPCPCGQKLTGPSTPFALPLHHANTRFEHGCL